MQSAKLERVGWGGGVKIEKGGGELCVFLRQDGGDVREGNSREGILVQKKRRDWTRKKGEPKNSSS